MLTKSADEHQHILKKAYKKTQVYDSPWYFLMRVCIAPGCKYHETYDLVQEVPITEPEGSKEK